MRIETLPPPDEFDAAASLTTRASGDVLDQPRPASHPLADPRPASPRRRPFFHPIRGWFRRTERNASHFLSRHIYPWVPGIQRPYTRQLLRQLSVSVATIPVPALPGSFEGLRILLITDVHAGPFVEPAALSVTFDKLARLEPDLILLGGDLTTSRVEELERTAAAFRSLRAPLGVFAVLGNHDYYTGEVERLVRRVESYGIEVLNNRSVDLHKNNDRLSLAGVDDMTRGRPDLAVALEEATAPVVLLSHHPDLFFDAARMGVALTLAGHTHAGQIRLPGLPVLVRQSRYRLDEGRYRLGQSELVVSRGLGAVGLPWRVACPPEVVLLTLQRKAAG